jgi:O-antigen/teichoic acid export membrane protein
MAPLALMLLAIAANALSIVLGNTLAQSGHPTQESLVNLLAAVSNLLLSLALIPLWGMMGAAIAVAVSYFAYSIALRLFGQRELNVTV